MFNENINIFEDVERQKLLLQEQKEMLKGFSDVLGDKNIDPETGKISEYHRDNCSGCALCEE